MEYQYMLSNYNTNKARLYSQALNLTGGKEEANDLIQDTLYRILKNADRFTRGTNFLAWAGTILRNTFINNYRRKRRFKNIVDTEGQLAFEQQSVFNAGESNLSMQELQSAINELDEVYRIPFLMSYQGYKYEEIARETGRPLGTVKSRIFIARKQLQQQLGARYKRT